MQVTVELTDDEVDWIERHVPIDRGHKSALILDRLAAAIRDQRPIRPGDWVKTPWDGPYQVLAVAEAAALLKHADQPLGTRLEHLTRCDPPEAG